MDGHRDINSAADLAAVHPGDTLLVVPQQKGSAFKLPVKVRAAAAAAAAHPASLLLHRQPRSASSAALSP
jgi:hypothetical protein